MISKLTRHQLSAKYQSHNLYRPPDWRWRLIQFLITKHSLGTGIRSSARDDEYVRTAWHVIENLQRFAQAGDADELDSVIRKFPHVHYAYEIFLKTPARPDPALCLQARLLAGQSDGDIAKVMSITPETVRWY